MKKMSIICFAAITAVMLGAISNSFASLSDEAAKIMLQGDVAQMKAVGNPKRIKAEIARIRTEGSPTTLRELDGPKIPDSRNGAVLYNRAFALIQGEAHKADMDLISRAISTDDPLNTPQDWAKLREVLKKYSAVAPLVEEAAKRPDCRFWVGWEKYGPVATSFPHLAASRNLARLLAAEAVISAKDGNFTQAAHYLDLGFAFSNCLRYQPTLIAELVRVAVVNISARALKTVLSDGDLSAGQARPLLATLARTDLSSALYDSLRMERASGIALFDIYREKGPDYLDYNPAGGKKPAPFKKTEASVLMCNADEMTYLNEIKRFIAAARLPYRKLIGTTKLAEDTDFPHYAIVTAILLPILERLPMSFAEGQAGVNGSRIAIALSVYHRQHKAYPKNLSVLAGSLNGKNPIDPFSGKGFIYKQQGTGYLLYSMGPNLKDDGGKEAASGEDRKEKGDIVWRMD